MPVVTGFYHFEDISIPSIFHGQKKALQHDNMLRIKESGTRILKFLYYVTKTIIIYMT